MGKDLALTEEFSWLLQSSEGDLDNATASGRYELADQLSIAGNVFSFKTAEGTTESDSPRQLYFIYLGGKKPKSRSLFEGSYDEDEPKAPVCTSVDGVSFEPGSVPPVITDPNSPHIGQPTTGCRECPMSKWGSKVSLKTGKAVPACGEHKDMAVKVLGIPGVWLLRLPPASWSSWDQATSKIKLAIAADAGAHGGKSTMSLATCVFSVSFGPGMGNLIFERKAWLNPNEPRQRDELLQVVALRKDAEGLDRVLWGPEGTARRAQYEAPGHKVALPAPIKELPAATEEPAAPPPEPAKVSRRHLAPKTLNEDTSPLPLPLPVVETAMKPAAKKTPNIADIMAQMGLG
jgi:hypothetical protein